jgi:C_GCAxxG_C_C family probable redox protein
MPDRDGMLVAGAACMGLIKGCQTLEQCIRDKDIFDSVYGAYEEVCRANGSAANPDEFEQLFRRLQNQHSKALRETAQGYQHSIPEFAALALLCKQKGIMPYHTAQVLACILLHFNDGRILADTDIESIKTLLIDQTKFRQEPEMVQLLTDRLRAALSKPGEIAVHDPGLVQMVRTAWETGFEYEKIYHGCAQCTVLASRKAFGLFDEKVFEAASALAGGMSLHCDAACGGYSGGLLTIGMLGSRKLEDLQTGSKDSQQKGMELAHRLHERFIACYGSVICRDIHRDIFGRTFDIRDEKDSDEMEKAGSHRDKCTTVVGTAMSWLAEILYEEGIRQP